MSPGWARSSLVGVTLTPVDWSYFFLCYLVTSFIRIARLQNLGGGNTDVYVLGKRPSGRFTADVRVQRSRLVVLIDGKTKVNVDVGYWKYSTNYFKAGGTFTWPLSVLFAVTAVDMALPHFSLLWGLLLLSYVAPGGG